MHYTYIKNKMNPYVNLEDCIQDGGTAIPRLVPRLAHCSLLSHLLPTDRQPSRNSTVFGNVLCADSVTPCRAHLLFGDVDGRSARPRPLELASGQVPSRKKSRFAISNSEMPMLFQLHTLNEAVYYLRLISLITRLQMVYSVTQYQDFNLAFFNFKCHFNGTCL
jgi:hypothetical protein